MGQSRPKQPVDVDPPNVGRPRRRLLTIWSSVHELTEIRYRTATTRRRIDQLSALLFGGGYVAIAVACASGADLPDRRTSLIAAALVVLYAIGYRTEFVSAAGGAVPTQPILVGMLLLLPHELVPATVLLGLVTGAAWGLDLPSFPKTFLVCAVNGWHCLGPVLVLALAAPQARVPAMENWPTYLAALMAQFVIDLMVSAVRAWAHGMTSGQLIGPLSWTFAIDSLLAPIGLCMVLTAGPRAVTVGLLAVPIALVGLLARDRTEHLQAAVSLNSAFVNVHEEARVDALTGLTNRRGWEEALDEAEHRAKADSSATIIVIAADLDGLKKVNDTYGHEAGDDIIRAMAEVLRRCVPRALAVTRLGGDEYGVLIAPEPREPGATEILAVIRATMAAHPGVHGNPLSASLGAACCPPESSVREAALIADARAFDDKRDRRVART